LTEPENHEHDSIAAMIRAVDVRAPERLHERVAQMVADAPSTRRPFGALLARPSTAPRRPLVALRTSAALAAAAAVVAVVAIAATGGFAGTAGQPSAVSAAARLTLAQGTAPAPAERPAGEDRLAAAVEGVAFPYWKDALGWRATAMRTGTIDGRQTEVVYYASPSGRRVGYAIVGGLPAPSPSGGSLVWRHGTEYHLLRINGVEAVVWLRDGRLCIVSGHGLSGSTLVHLASFERPAVTSSATPA
jgi:hypothetical protein